MLLKISLGEFVNKLLLTRLRRSLMRTKIRVITVTLLITLTAYLGVTMSEFTRNMNSVYDDFYSETNLADLMVIDEPVSYTHLTLPTIA